jgi:hypothetical protein
LGQLELDWNGLDDALAGERRLGDHIANRVGIARVEDVDDDLVLGDEKRSRVLDFATRPSE